MGSSAVRSTGAVVWLLLLLAAFPAGHLAAQEPVPPDTLPRDTIVVPIPPERVAVDTVPEELRPEAVDTIGPAPNFPVFPDPAPAGWTAARWVWTREELNRFHGLSLLELLAQVPGLNVVRAGGFGRPAAVTAFGLGGGRLRVVLDGYELDPLAAANLDLQQIALVDLEEVRLERGFNEIRLELLTFRLPDTRPFSQLEAATGDYQSRLLRAIFSRTLGQRSVLFLGFDLVDTGGLFRQQPFTASTGVARWSYAFGPAAGVEAEYRQSGIVSTGAPFVQEFDRRDLILRGRASPLPGLTVDALLGRSWRQPGDRDTLDVRLASNQAAVRALYETGPAWVVGGARLRGEQTGFAAPGLELSLGGGLRPLPWLHATAEVRQASTDEVTGTELEGTARLGPLLGFSLFATGATGTRGVGLVRDTLIPVLDEDPDTEERMDTLWLFPTFASSMNGMRVGAEWEGWGARIGAAYLTLDTDLAVPFGLPFDRRADPVVGEPAAAAEAYLSVPVFYRPLRLDAAYTRWFDVGGRPYLPVEEGRIALSFHDLFYTGNLEPTVRLEAVHRASMLVPQAEGQAFDDVSAPYTLLNFYLQIRVLDVRAFVVWENILNQAGADLPGRWFTGQRALYGVRWHFFN